MVKKHLLMIIYYYLTSCLELGLGISYSDINQSMNRSKVEPSDERIKRQSNTTVNNRINVDWRKFKVAVPIQSTNYQDNLKLLTVAKSLKAGETTINITWRVQLINLNSSSTIIKDDLNGHLSQGQPYLPTEWTLRVRQFGTLYVKLRFISELIDTKVLLSTGFKDINFMVTTLNDGIAYEVCLQSKDFPVLDEIDTVLRRVSISSKSDLIVEPNMVCKEVVTARSQCSNQLTPGKIATVTVVSSASTFIIVIVVGWCWCPNRKSSVIKDDHLASEDVEDYEDEEHQKDQENQKRTKKSKRINWLKWSNRSADSSRNSHQTSTGKSLMIHNPDYDNNKNNTCNKNDNNEDTLDCPKGKVKRWLTLWRRSRTCHHRSIWFSKDYGGNVDLKLLDGLPLSPIYRPKSWPQDEWTVKGLSESV